MGLTPNIFDVARIERLLKSMNAKLETMESIMLEHDDEMREVGNELEEESDRHDEMMKRARKNS